MDGGGTHNAELIFLIPLLIAYCDKMGGGVGINNGGSVLGREKNYCSSYHNRLSRSNYCISESRSDGKAGEKRKNENSMKRYDDFLNPSSSHIGVVSASQV